MVAAGRAGGIYTLEVSGPVTLAEVVRWHDLLCDGLGRGDSLLLELSGSGPWDLAGVQLLIAALASAGRLGRPLALVNPPGVLLALAERAGLSDRLPATVGA